MVGDSLRLRLAALLPLVLAAFAATAFPQTDAPQRAAARWEPDRLRRVIEERYRVVPLRDGVALVPRRESRDVKSIELSGDTVAINGTSVTGAELRERLQSDSDVILALSYLDPESRRALFESGRKVGGPPPSAATPGTEPRGNPPPEGQTPAPSTTGAAESPLRSEPRASQSDAKIHIGGPVQVDENESVDGPVVAIGGSVTVDGEVRQDVVAIGGNVRLGPKARVLGDVTAVGGSIEKDPRAEIDGKINEINFRFPHVHLGPSFWLPATGFLAGAFGPWVELMASLFRMVLFGLLAFLVFLLARNPVGRIERTAAVEPWKAGLVGLLAQLLFIPVFVLTIIILAVSIIGIPLLLFVPPLAILAFIAALVFGFTGVAYRVGRWAEQRFGWAPQSPFVLLLVGLLGIWALTIVGRIISLGGWPIWFVSSALLVVGFLVEYVAWTVGLGAAVMTRFGTRPAAGGGSAASVGTSVPAGPQVGGTA
jgi:hypothetical protein